MSRRGADDNPLLRKLARRDAAALGVLYDRHATALHRWLLANGLPPTDAEGRWRVEGLVPGAEYRATPRDPVTGYSPRADRFIAGETAQGIELVLGAH